MSQSGGASIPDTPRRVRLTRGRRRAHTCAPRRSWRGTLGGSDGGVSSRRELLIRSGAVVAAAGLPRWLAAAGTAAAAASARDPAIIGTYGGLVVPPTGAYFGADDTTRGFTGAKGIETQLGRRMGIRNRRYGWLATCPN